MVGWFEIPVQNMNRAKKFFDTVFGISISIHDFGGLKMGWFPNDPDKKGATGSLVQHESYIPSTTDGALVYFSCEDLAHELKKVEAAGGTVLRPKTQIGEGHGFMALLADTEGNRIALHSHK
jgi:predicted enzyme related to lactoylglutathione lyase